METLVIDINSKEDIGLASAIDEGRISGYVDEKTVMNTLDL